MSNYQPELAEYFNNEEDCVMYSSLEEAFEKAEFYIKHDDLRKEISKKGNKKVQAYFDYPSRIENMLELAKLR